MDVNELPRRYVHIFFKTPPELQKKILSSVVVFPCILIRMSLSLLRKKQKGMPFSVLFFTFPLLPPFQLHTHFSLEKLNSNYEDIMCTCNCHGHKLVISLVGSIETGWSSPTWASDGRRDAVITASSPRYAGGPVRRFRAAHPAERESLR
jgi:hypothetical protein